MKVILYMAISTDGFIARSNGDSDWVSEVDSEIFNKKIKEAGCIVVGRRTFEQYLNELYPIKGVLNIVLTRNNSQIRQSYNLIITNKTPKEVVKLADQKGYKQILVIGGGHLSGSFLKENLIDEIFLSVHPIILGSGIKLFEDTEVFKKLKLLGIKSLKEDLVQLHYKIVK